MVAFSVRDTLIAFAKSARVTCVLAFLHVSSNIGHMKENEKEFRKKALLCYYISPYDDYLVNSVILLLFNNIFNI